jgi:O-antigen/teichoic acid export membrane protein
VSGSRLREIAGSSAKVGLATLAGLVGWVVGGKILALELGAAGVGVFGLLRQLQQNLTTVATCNGATALVQGISTRTGDDRARYARTLGRIYLAGGIGVSLVMLLGAPWLGPWLVPDAQGVALLRWLSLAVLATTAQAYYTGLLTANRSIDALVRAQVLGPVAVLVLAWPMARLVRAGQPAGLVLMLIAPGAAIAAAAYLRARKAGLLPAPSRAPVDRSAVRSFFRMSGVYLLAGLVGTGTQYLQSRLVAGSLGLSEAGIYWVAWTLSMSYVSIILGSYGSYYMPALSALADPEERRALIRDYLHLALLVMPVLVVGVILFKPWIVRLMFSVELLPSLRVMRWMLVGDLFKGVSWVLAFPMLAFGELRLFVATEVAFNLASLGATWAWLAWGGGVEGLGVIFLVLYVAYLGAMAFYIWKVHGFRARGAEAVAFLAGLALVGVASVPTWSETRVTASSLLVAVPCLAVFAAWGVRWVGSRRERTS